MPLREAVVRRISGLARLSNWPFALKWAFCPTLAIAALIGMGLYGISATGTQATLIHAVVQRDLATVLRLSGNAAQLQAINDLVHRLATPRFGLPRDAGPLQEASRLIAQTRVLAADLEEQAHSAPAGQNRSDLALLVQELRLYGGAIGVFGAMLETDPRGAATFFQQSDQNAVRIISLFRLAADRAVQDARRRANESTLLAERTRSITITASLAGSALLFGIVALLTRATVQSVRRIAAAAEQVTRDCGSVDIATLARRDELGSIVQSLAMFQANVAQIAFLAHHDSLTRLPNRVLFHDRVQQALGQMDRGTTFAVLGLDLDRFKAVNDTLGHPVGDILLRQVADRLQACVREGDTVARLGGDEFGIVLLNVGEASEIGVLCARIIDAVGAGYWINGHQVDISIGIGIGIANACTDGLVPHDLLKNADTALYRAKANGRNTFCFYAAAMTAAPQSRRALELGLHQAVAHEEFQLHYQPLVDARSRSVSGFEALIRWRHPERGMVAPDEFIPVAEASGLIGPIGQWILRTACFDAMSWPGRITVAVNLSPFQFRDKHLVSHVRAALAASGLPADRLELEITESVLLHDGDAILATLREIKALGVQVSMDDFGTGSSSLSSLRHFPFDKVKIDRSFIKDLPHDRDALAIVRAIVGLSETFGIAVTAEGVETDEQAAQLTSEACTQLQGFLFSRPMPVTEVAAILRSLSGSLSVLTAA